MVFTIGNKQKFKVVVGSVPPIWQGPSAPDNPADESSFEDHAVLIVGISSGSTSCQEPHFIVQNSWGAAKPNEVACTLCRFAYHLHLPVFICNLCAVGGICCTSDRAAPFQACC